MEDSRFEKVGVVYEKGFYDPSPIHIVTHMSYTMNPRTERAFYAARRDKRVDELTHLLGLTGPDLQAGIERLLQENRQLAARQETLEAQIMYLASQPEWGWEADYPAPELDQVYGDV